MKAISFGRHPDNDIVISDYTIALHHMQIIQHDDGRLTLVDLHSTNGTYINGKRVEGTAELHYGDIVKIGNTTLNWEYYSLAEALKNLSNEPPTRPPFENAMCYCPAHPEPPEPPATGKRSPWIIVLVSILIMGLIGAVLIFLYI